MENKVKTYHGIEVSNMEHLSEDTYSDMMSELGDIITKALGPDGAPPKPIQRASIDEALPDIRFTSKIMENVPASVIADIVKVVVKNL